MGTITRERERAASLFAANKSSPNRSLLLLLSNSESILHFAALRNKKAEKMISSLMIVLLALAGSQAAKLTSTGVDLEPIFEFLDNDGSGGVNSDELKELTVAGDEDGDGVVTAAEFQAAWEDIAVGFGVPAEKHSKYFGLVDGVDGTADDGEITEAENSALFGKIDADGNEEISTGQRLLHLLFNSLIDSRFDFFLSFFLLILTFFFFFFFSKKKKKKNFFPKKKKKKKKK